MHGDGELSSAWNGGRSCCFSWFGCGIRWREKLASRLLYYYAVRVVAGLRWFCVGTPIRGRGCFVAVDFDGVIITCSSVVCREEIPCCVMQCHDGGAMSSVKNKQQC